jgi:hypothetical protein
LPRLYIHLFRAKLAHLVLPSLRQLGKLMVCSSPPDGLLIWLIAQQLLIVVLLVSDMA